MFASLYDLVRGGWDTAEADHVGMRYRGSIVGVWPHGLTLKPFGGWDITLAWRDIRSIEVERRRP